LESSKHICSVDRTGQTRITPDLCAEDATPKDCSAFGSTQTKEPTYAAAPSDSDTRVREEVRRHNTVASGYEGPLRHAYTTLLKKPVKSMAPNFNSFPIEHHFAFFTLQLQPLYLRYIRRYGSHHRPLNDITRCFFLHARVPLAVTEDISNKAIWKITSGYILRIPERACKYQRRSVEWRILTCPKSVSVHPPKTALLRCQFTSYRNHRVLDSPVLLAHRGNLLHLAHALIVRNFVVVVAAVDLVLA
jgi:hypothetical protein